MILINRVLDLTIDILVIRWLYMSLCFYEMKIIENTYEEITNEYDSFFLSGASEYRAYEILRKFDENNVKIREVVLFDFLERHDTGDNYCNYKKTSYRIKEVACSIKDPSDCFKKLDRRKYIFNKYKNIAIDISCFTKPYFYYIIKYFKEIVGLRTIDIYYTEPATYILNKGLYESYHSTSGSLEIIELDGFAGDSTDNKYKILIILLGFDGELSRTIVREVDVDEIILINGFPPYSPIFKDISIINNIELTSFDLGNKIFYANANNPFDTFNLLELIKRSKPNSYINIAALGTKPMALGACLFATLNPEVRVIYTLPDKYSNETAKNCCKSWFYRIPLI